MPRKVTISLMANTVTPEITAHLAFCFSVTYLTFLFERLVSCRDMGSGCTREWRYCRGDSPEATGAGGAQERGRGPGGAGEWQTRRSPACTRRPSRLPKDAGYGRRDPDLGEARVPRQFSGGHATDTEGRYVTENRGQNSEESNLSQSVKQPRVTRQELKGLAENTKRPSTLFYKCNI